MTIPFQPLFIVSRHHNPLFLIPFSQTHLNSQTMTVSLGPAKFYGTSLPRPRIYADVKFNDHRVDPPTPVNAPLMSWAQEAHWSMGGLNFKRLRLQGKIEGNVERLRTQLEKAWTQSPTPPAQSKRAASLSPPPAPIVTKRRRFMDLIEEEDEKEVTEAPVSGLRRSRLVKKLGDDFDKVALDNNNNESESHTTPLVKGRQPVKKTVVEQSPKSNPKANKSAIEAEKISVSVNRVRTSPRLAKRVSN